MKSIQSMTRQELLAAVDSHLEDAMSAHSSTQLVHAAVAQVYATIATLTPAAEADDVVRVPVLRIPAPPLSKDEAIKVEAFGLGRKLAPAELIDQAAGVIAGTRPATEEDHRAAKRLYSFHMLAERSGAVPDLGDAS